MYAWSFWCCAHFSLGLRLYPVLCVRYHSCAILPVLRITLPCMDRPAWIAPYVLRGSYLKEDREVPEAILGEKIPHTLVTVGMHFDIEILMIRSKLDHLTQSTWKGGTAIFQRTEFTIRTTGVSHSTTIL